MPTAMLNVAKRVPAQPIPDNVRFVAYTASDILDLPPRGYRYILCTQIRNVAFDR